VLPVGSLASNAASVFGLMAAAIAVFGFLVQAPAALTRKDDQTLRATTVVGGLFGLLVAVGFVIMDLW
jgi:uncharacterized protein with PQ loop repeat